MWVREELARQRQRRPNQHSRQIHPARAQVLHDIRCHRRLRRQYIQTGVVALRACEVLWLQATLRIMRCSFHVPP